MLPVPPPDSDKIMEVSYNAVSGNLSVGPEQGTHHSHQPRPEPAGCFLLFDGMGLTQEGLKDWLRLCAKQVKHSFS